MSRLSADPAWRYVMTRTSSGPGVVASAFVKGVGGIEQAKLTPLGSTEVFLMRVLPRARINQQRPSSNPHDLQRAMPQPCKKPAKNADIPLTDKRAGDNRSGLDVTRAQPSKSDHSRYSSGPLLSIGLTIASILTETSENVNGFGEFSVSLSHNNTKPHPAWYRSIGFLAVLCGSACGEIDEVRDTAAPVEVYTVDDGATPVSVLIHDGDIIIEGDIVIGHVDGEVSQESLKRSYQAARIAGRQYHWPNGVVPYDFDAGVSDPDRTKIVSAMAAWANEAPGLQFVAASGQSDFIRFFTRGWPDQACGISPVGRQGGRQDIKLNPECMNSFTVHHEIAHSLGFYHEQSRKDRDAHVSIIWSEIIGCPSSAQGSGDCGCGANQCGCGGSSCNDGTQFNKQANTSSILAYDIASIMHYRLDAFSKTDGVATMSSSDAGASSAGQRAKFGPLDTMKMRVAYPIFRMTASVFQSSVPSVLCALDGREEDIATDWQITGWPLLESQNRGYTTIAPGDYVVTCNATSKFWESKYDYPNFNQYPLADGYQSSDEHFTTTNSIRVLSAGLIPVFTNL